MRSARPATVDPSTTTLLIAAILSTSGAAVSLAQESPEMPPAGFPAAAQAADAAAAAKPKKEEYPPFDKVVEGLTKVISTADGAASLYDLYRDNQSGKLLAVLPREHDKQLIMIACTVTAGDPEAGVMGPTHYARWEKVNKQLALVAPNLSVRTDGGKEAKDSAETLYTGRVLLSTPILAMTPDGRPVIDLGSVALQQAPKLFGSSPWGGYGPSLGMLDHSLAKLTKAKAFPKNIVIEYQAPKRDGQVVRLAYSIGELKGTPGYKPRKADPRVGYFYDWHLDFARTQEDKLAERYINRWHIEKADPKLKNSPPRQPIVWYIEHTTPVRYRRYVREGIEMWNQAFAEIGIVGALEVHQQDAVTGAHMDKDPEDARYNFFRWNSSDRGYAIGPSRTNPETGEILDADVVWHQGLTRAVRSMLEDLSDDLAQQTFGPETMAFLAEHPQWDPRVRLASPERREEVTMRIALEAETARKLPLSDPAHPWTAWTHNHMNRACRIGGMLSMDLSLADAAFAAGMLPAAGASDEDLLDGLPEAFLGAMIRYIAAHEVGHCLGLQHNMAASSIRSLSEINTPGFEGATIGTVMDYAAANINHGLGEAQGPYATPVLGPYDRWAIAFGYGPEEEREKVLARVSEPEHIFLSQAEMATGSDPRNMTWDLGSDNLQFCESRLGLVRDVRSKLVSDIVDKGESWAVARRRYQATMGAQIQALWIASRWIGGTFSNNDFKGDPGDRPPVQDVPCEQQRRALRLIIENAFEDGAFGLTPELVRHFGKEYWWDPMGTDEILSDPSFTVHDLVGGVQATALTLVLNPTLLRRVYDNEFRTNGDGDRLTLAEVVATVTDAVWREAAQPSAGEHTASSPMVSSFRRNLQREHVERLMTLAMLDRTTSPALRTISTLATAELRRIDSLVERAAGAKPDPYTSAHFTDIRERIARALEAQYIRNR
jgi:hypothetical protein